MKFSPYSDKVFEILSEVILEYLHVSMDEVLEKNRQQWLYEIRCICISLYKELTHETIKQIANRFNRNVSSVFYADINTQEYKLEDAFLHNYLAVEWKVKDRL